jgi:hypothetical protein
MSSTQWILTTAIVLSLSLAATGGALPAQRVRAEKPHLVQPDKAGQPRAANDQVPLQWKFERDKPFYQEMTVVTRQAMKFVNGEVSRAQEQTFFFSWRPVGQDKDGNWVLKQKVEGVRILIDNIDGIKVEYDSRKDDGTDDHLLAWYCRFFVGSEFTVTFGKDSKVHKVEGRDELIKKMSAADPTRTILSQQALCDTTLLQAAEILLNPLNPNAVQVGDSWTCKQILDCPLIGKIESRHRFSYGQREGKMIRIPVQSALEVKEPKGKGKDIKGKGTGTVLFDHEIGRIVAEELDLHLKGRIDVASQGTNLIPAPSALIHTAAELTESQKITVKTSDSNPVQLREQ